MCLSTHPTCPLSHKISNRCSPLPGPFSPMSPMLALCCLFLILLTSSAQQDEFTYIGFSGNNNGSVSLNGAAEVDINGLLRLTNETSRIIGHAFHPTLIRFKDSPNSSTVHSFSTAFVFAFLPEFAALGGHGLAFAISPTTTLPGALPSQYLGLLSPNSNGNTTNHIFAVEFDTVQDFEFGDINDNHIGINLNSMISNASAPAAYYSPNGTKLDLIMKKGTIIQAWIDYDGASKLLHVTIAPSSTKPSTPIITYPVDLASILHEQMYVGFSASTGLLASSHYLFGWKFKLNGSPATSLDLSSLPSLPQTTNRKTKTTIIAVTSTAASVTAIILIAAAILYIYHKIKNADVIEQWELDYGPHRFSYAELKRATHNFRDTDLLGVGGFGKVYKGTLPTTNVDVAVKRISNGSRQGIREFVAEIASIGRLRHRNLVPLQGWCRRRDDMLLVYDYMPNGSLDKALFDIDDKALTWSQRMRIIRGIASALLYLHEEWEHVVIHRDVKASNVLLDNELNGRLGDFGLAKLYEHGANPSTTRIVGTLGYLAPEMSRTGRATTGSDVFAFGALALEVVCGRRPIEPKAAPEELVLVDWVWERWEEAQWQVVVDPRLGGVFDKVEAELAVRIGLLCSHPVAEARPTMREVVRYLDEGGNGEMPELRVAPVDYDEMGRDGLADFEHSYASSSFGKLTAMTSLVAGGGR